MRGTPVSLWHGAFVRYVQVGHGLHHTPPPRPAGSRSAPFRVSAPVFNHGEQRPDSQRDADLSHGYESRGPPCRLAEAIATQRKGVKAAETRPARWTVTDRPAGAVPRPGSRAEAAAGAPAWAPVPRPLSPVRAARLCLSSLPLTWGCGEPCRQGSGSGLRARILRNQKHKVVRKVPARALVSAKTLRTPPLRLLCVSLLRNNSVYASCLAPKASVPALSGRTRGSAQSHR